MHRYRYPLLIPPHCCFSFCLCPCYCCYHEMVPAGSYVSSECRIQMCCHRKVCCVSRVRQLDKAVEGHQPNNRIAVCTFLPRKPGGALPESDKNHLLGLIICMFLRKLSQAGSTRVSSGLNVL